MIREIKFRGKRIHDGKWVYGSLLQSEIAGNGYAKCAICERFADSFNIREHDVFPKSVGEFTGVQDKNGKDIYEGDIILKPYTDRPYSSKAKTKLFKSIVKYHIHNCGEFDSEKIESDYKYGCRNGGFDDAEIIGNIHESNTVEH